MGKNTKKQLSRIPKEIEASKESNAMIGHIETPIEDNADVENIGNTRTKSAVPATAIIEDAMEIDKTTEDVNANPIQNKKTRGPTKVKRLPLDVMSRIEVEFNGAAVPIGPGSVKLSSFLGPLVREHVPVTLNDWRQLPDELKVVLWKSIQARFKLDEEWQKGPIFRQMGCIFRTSKCCLVKQIKNAKSEEERLQLKPDCIKSVKEWKRFVKSKTNADFKIKSEKFKAIRNMQMLHTCSRRGMARLTEDLKEQSDNPSSVSRAQVWIKSHTRKNGEPVNKNVADTIEKIKKIENDSQSTSSRYNIKEDALVQVLGQDKPGRLRAMGNGVTMTKVVLANANEKQVAQFQNRISELERIVHKFMNNQGKESWREENISQMNKHSRIGDDCDILHWNGNDEVVAEGRIVPSDPNELFNEVPLGPHAMKVLIICPRKADAFLWRPSPGLVYIGDAKDEIVAWPANRVVMRMIENSKDENVSKTNGSEIKCVLYDWNGSEELVAEGRVYSSDANHLINGIPLGPNAMIVLVDNPKKQDAYLWRPIVGMTCIGEAVGKKIAWPESKLGFEQVNNKVAPNPTINNATSPTSANSMVNNKCKLIDVRGTGMVVAEGTVSSTDPEILVHSVPLGKDAVRVWVETVKVKKAPLWRTSFAFSCMEDAIGSTVAWPIANVRMDSVCSK